MESEQCFLMKGGDAAVETSYANNSLLQRTVISMVNPILEECVAETYCRLFPECLRVADLGCSAGPNTLLVLSEIADIVARTCRNQSRTPRPWQAFLNDLYGNDFNTVFKSLPSFYERLEEEHGKQLGRCFVSAVPGSFYGRLFPSDSLHFVHSSYALILLSKVPKGLVSDGGEILNKGNICVAKTSPPAVHRAFFQQFQRDFTLFLRSRAEELVPGGSMMLTILGSIKSNDPLSLWEPIGLSLNDMVIEGLIEEEKLDTFDLPYYIVSEEEARKLIEEEGSFTLHRLETIKMDWDDYIKKAHGDLGEHATAKILSATLRAVGEPILAGHFGESAMDELFRKYEGLVLGHMVAHKCKLINLVMCLTKKA